MIQILFAIVLSFAVQAQPEQLPLGLVGTIVRTEGDQSVATVQFTQTKETGAYRGGSNIGSLAKILKIERDRLEVTNLKTGKPAIIGLSAYNPKQAVSKQAIDAPGANKEFHIKRSLIDSTLSNLPKFLMDARAEAVPGPGDTVNGFKLEDITPGSLYEKLGLKNGDVLKEVNGVKLDSVTRAVEIFYQFQNSSMIKLITERGGKSQELTYLIRE